MPLHQVISPHHRRQVRFQCPSWGCSPWDWLTCCRGWRRTPSGWSSRGSRWQQSWTGPQRVWRAFASKVYREDGLTGRWGRIILQRKSTSISSKNPYFALVSDSQAHSIFIQLFGRWQRKIFTFIVKCANYDPLINSALEVSNFLSNNYIVNHLFWRPIFLLNQLVQS